MADRATTGVAGQAVTALGVIRARYPELPSAPQRVAEQIMLDPSAASRTTIVELAERSGTAQPTTFRPDALSTRHPQLAVLDLLVVGVAQRTSQTITH